MQKGKIMKKGDIVRFTGKSTYLETNNEYKVYQVFDEGIRVYTETGFAGIEYNDCILVQIAE